MKIIQIILRILVGGLFIFSGIIKLNDPKGTGYKFEQYFDAFANDFQEKQDTIKLFLSKNNTNFVEHKKEIQYGNFDAKILVHKSPIFTKIIVEDDPSNPEMELEYEYLASEIKTYFNNELIDSDTILMADSSDGLIQFNYHIGSKKIEDFNLNIFTDSSTIEKNGQVKNYHKKEGFIYNFFIYLKKWSLFLSVFMCVLEVMLGFALLIGFKPKFTMWSLLLIITFFTFLTGYTYYNGYCPKLDFLFYALFMLILAVFIAQFHNKKWFKWAILAYILLYAIFFYLYNIKGLFFECEFTKDKMKVKDCGCFGDFLPLKPYESFYKDLVLMFMILILFILKDKIKPIFSNIFSWNAMALSTIFSIVFGVVAIMFQPYWDFLPYEVGFDLNEKMKTPKNAIIGDIKETIYIYEKNGEKKEFNSDEVKKLDSTWSYINYREKFIADGWKSKYSDFSINKRDGFPDNPKDSILLSNTPVIFIVVKNIEETRLRPFKKIAELAKDASKKGYLVYGITSSRLSEADLLVQKYDMPVIFFNGDETVIKTFIRSNPGIMLFKKGKIIDKWSSRNIPNINNIEKLLN